MKALRNVRKPRPCYIWMNANKHHRSEHTPQTAALISVNRFRKHKPNFNKWKCCGEEARLFFPQWPKTNTPNPADSWIVALCSHLGCKWVDGGFISTRKTNIRQQQKKNVKKKTKAWISKGGEWLQKVWYYRWLALSLD